jgi:hypothetical protein
LETYKKQTTQAHFAIIRKAAAKQIPLTVKKARPGHLTNAQENSTNSICTTTSKYFDFTEKCSKIPEIPNSSKISNASNKHIQELCPCSDTPHTDEEFPYDDVYIFNINLLNIISWYMSFFT